LGFGAPRSRLDIHEAVVGVERIGEHAPEFEVRDGLPGLRDVGLDRRERRIVVLGARELEQLPGVAQLAIEAGEDADGVLELFLFAPQLLGALGIGPDVRLFELPRYFGEARLLALEVKDTSAALPTACSGRRASRRSD